MADPIEVDGDNNFPGPPDEKHLVKPDGDMRLSKCTLRDALDSAYGILVAHFLGNGHTPSKKLFEEDIPAIVFELGFGAGWLEVTEAALTPDEVVRTGIANQDPEYKGRKLVLFGDLMIDTWYKEAFLAILEPSISGHSQPGPTVPNGVDARTTTKKQREDLLQEYLKTHEGDKPKVRVTDLPKLAGVDYRDFKRWRKGPPTEETDGLSDSSVKSQRLYRLLVYDDRRFSRLVPKKEWWELSPP
jgi:hypothetical protein